MRTATSSGEMRVLVLARPAAEADAICAALARGGVESRSCATMAELCAGITDGAACAVIAEEAVGHPARDLLKSMLVAQPAWSDFPVIVLSQAGAPKDRNRLDELCATHHIVIVERSTNDTGLTSVVRAALRTRTRQYFVRDETRTRAQVDRSLRESEQRLRIALRAGRMVAWEWTVTAVSDAWSETLDRTFGGDASESDAAAYAPHGSVHTDDRQIILAKLRETLQTLSPFEVEYRVTKADGGVSWIEARGELLFDARGRPNRMAGISKDVTERRRAEESRARLAAIVESSDDAIISKTLEGVITSWNDGAERMFGFTAPEIVGRSIQVLLTEAGRSEEDHILACLRRGERISNYETVRVAKDRRHIDVSITVSPIRDSSGWIIGASGIIRDITGQKRAAHALRESEERLRQLAETIREVFYVTEPDGVKYVSHAYETLWRRSVQSLYDDPRSFLEAIHPEDRPRVERSLQRQMSGEPTTEEYRIIRPDGSERWIHDRAFPVHDSEGRVQRVVGDAKDITEQREAERALRIRARQQHAVAQAGELALRERDLQKVFAHATAMIARTLEVEYCKVLELLPGGNELLLRAGVGFPEEMTSVTTVSADLDSQAGYTLESDTPVIVTDLRAEQRFSGPPLLRDMGIVSGMSCVIRCGGGAVWGVLGTHSGRRVAFTPDDINFLLAIANVLGDAIQRQQDEQALRESEERFRMLADNMSQFAWMADARGWVFWYNKRWYDYTGTTLEEVQGWGWKTVHHPDHVDRVVERLQHSWDTGAPWEDLFPLRGRDGSYRWFLSRALPIRDADGNVVCWFGTNTDVTEQQLADAALRESEERLRLAQEAGGVGTFEWDIRTNRNVWSAELEALYGLPPGGFGGTYQAWAALVHPDDRERAEADVSRSLRSGELESEWRVTLPGGGVAWLEARGWVERDANGTPLRMLGVNVDITERKRHEQQLRTVMSELNHRVKNTLAVVDAMAQQTMLRARGLEDFRVAFSERLRSMAAAHSLLTRMDWSGADLRDILASELKSRVSSPTHLALAGPPMLIKPRAALALHMVVHELATNATKYGSLSAERGRLDVSWRVSSEPASSLRIVWVESGGPPPQPPTASGYGTQMIEEVLEHELEGTIERRYAPEGLRCTIAVPLSDVQGADPAPVPEGDEPPASARGRVLLAEDSFLLARSMSMHLAAWGYRVVGPAASVARASHLASASRVEAGVLDVDLHGERVYGLARELRERAVPFVLLTGFNPDDIPPDLRGCTLMAKPINLDQLRVWLSENVTRPLRTECEE